MTFLANDPRRTGHTMIELVTAMVASAILLVGLGSVMLIARQIAYTPSASTHRLEASKIIGELADELRMATYITERSPNLLAFVVSDRDGDGTEDRIRYEWSGTPGDPLLRTYNGGEPVAVLDSVKEFAANYVVESEATTLTTTIDSSEAVLYSNATVQSGTDRDVTASFHSAQQLNPAAFASIPANAISWNATKIDFYGRNGAGTMDTLLVRLRPSGDPYGGPTSHVVTQATVAESTLTSSLGWNTAVFDSPARDLALHRRYAMTWSGVGNGIIAKLRCNDGAAGGVLETNDAGASWQFMPTRQMYYRLYGTYTTPGPSYDVTRNYVSHIQLVLRVGSATHSRIDDSVALLNRPELLSAYWRTDFDADPTSSDANGDGGADWQAATADEVVGSVPYDGESMSGGVWHVTGKLRSDPLHDFVEPTFVEVRFRDTSLLGTGAVVWINADWQGGHHAPLAVGVTMQADGSQTLWLMGKTNEATPVMLFQMDKLSTDFIRCRLAILPEHDVVNVCINDEDLGTYTYPTYTPSSTDRFVAVYGDTSTAEFDYVQVGVTESN